MKTKLTQNTIDLGTGKVVSLPDGKDWTISCIAGRLWLTAEGHVQDVILAAGQSLTLRDAGHVIVEACGDSRVRFLAPTAWPGRFAAALRPRGRGVSSGGWRGCAIGPCEA